MDDNPIDLSPSFCPEALRAYDLASCLTHRRCDALGDRSCGDVSIQREISSALRLVVVAVVVMRSRLSLPDDDGSSSTAKPKSAGTMRLSQVGKQSFHQ